MSWNSNPFVALTGFMEHFICRMPAVMGNSRNKYQIKDCTLDFTLKPSLVFINKQLYYVHSGHSHALTVVPGRPDAQNEDNPGTIARRKSPVIPISVMPLRKKRKSIPRNLCSNPSACSRQENTRHTLQYPHSPWENGGMPSCWT